MQATKALIHLENFRRNIQAARKKIGPHVKICLPVKADAYGHGSVSISRFALEAGVEYLAVAGVMEGVELREAGISAPILVLSQALPEELPLILSNGLTPFVSDLDFINEAAMAAEQAGKKLNVHLKIDTGMGRLGCHPKDAATLAHKIASHKGLNLEGTATHLAVSDSPEDGDIAYTKEQIARFKEAVTSIKKENVAPGLIHAANSGALVFHEDSYFDMIRPGIFLYGYSPNIEFQAEPVMEFRSAVAVIKKVKKGEAVSYGRTWIAQEDTNIGVIPAGYADGFRRGLGNNYSILIRGRAYPSIGRICMDNSMVDLGLETEVKRWDEAVIFGSGFLTAADAAEKLGTIPYEITCGINKRVPRIYVD